MKFYTYSLILLLAQYTVWAAKETGKNEEKAKPPLEIRRNYPEDYLTKRNVSAEQATFRKFVARRHAQRLGALRDLRTKTYSKQYQMLESILPPVFEAILNQRVLLESSGYIPGGEWPMNMTIRDAMTQVVEGALFMGEAFLRMPDVTRRMLKAKKEWELLIGWAWTFTSECLVYLDEKMHIPIEIMGQELGFIEKNTEVLKQYREELAKVVFLNKEVFSLISERSRSRHFKNGKAPRRSEATHESKENVRERTKDEFIKRRAVNPTKLTLLVRELRSKH